MAQLSKLNYQSYQFVLALPALVLLDPVRQDLRHVEMVVTEAGKGLSLAPLPVPDHLQVDIAGKMTGQVSEVVVVEEEEEDLVVVGVAEGDLLHVEVEDVWVAYRALVHLQEEVAWLREGDHLVILEADMDVEGHGLVRGLRVGVGLGVIRCGQADPARPIHARDRGQGRAQGLGLCRTLRTQGTVGVGVEEGLLVEEREVRVEEEKISGIVARGHQRGISRFLTLLSRGICFFSLVSQKDVLRCFNSVVLVPDSFQK